MEMILEQMKFACIGKGHGAPCLPATRREWEALRREPWLAQMCARIERGDEELKHRLPVWTPSCAEFRDNHRAQADAIKPLNRLMMDFDEKGHTDEIKARLMAHSPLTVLLIEESVRRGTHVLVELPANVSAEDAQALMKEATGFEPDKQVKGVDRCIYMVTEGHTKYVSDKLFEVAEGDTQGTGTSVTSQATSQVSQSPCVAESPCVPKFPQEFKGVDYNSIIAEYWRRTGGEPSEGERNKRLHQLAANLRAICDNNEEWLLVVMPRYGLSDQEMKSIIHSACKEPTKGSRLIDQIVNALEMGISSDEIEDAEAVAAETGVKVNVKALPIGLKESLTGVPVSMHMPLLCGIMPMAAAYADQVEVEYCDGNIHRLGLMSIIRGEQASNKSVVKNAVDVWKRQLEEEDALARKREEEWKERKKGRKANEKAPEDPHVLIRMVPVTVSCSTLLKRFKNA